MFGQRRRKRQRAVDNLLLLAAALAAASETQTKPTRKTKMEQNVNMDRSNELPPPAAIESKNEQQAGPYMPRIAFPSPFDRTPNEPAYLLSPGDLLRMYNSARPHMGPAAGKDDITGHLSKLDQRVIDWAREMATFEGWTNITFHGYQMLLIADVKIV